MNAIMKKVGTVVFVGTITLGSTSAIAWWNDNDRWRDGPWYGDHRGYGWGGYPGYGWGGYPGYGWGGYPGYGWGGYPGYGWGGYPGYGWGGSPGTTKSTPERTIE